MFRKAYAERKGERTFIRCLHIWIRKLQHFIPFALTGFCLVITKKSHHFRAGLNPFIIVKASLCAWFSWVLWGLGLAREKKIKYWHIVRTINKQQKRENICICYATDAAEITPMFRNHPQSSLRHLMLQHNCKYIQRLRGYTVEN